MQVLIGWLAAQPMINYKDGVFPVNRDAFEKLVQNELAAVNAAREEEVDGKVYTVPADKRFGQVVKEEVIRLVQNRVQLYLEEHKKSRGSSGNE